MEYFTLLFSTPIINFCLICDQAIQINTGAGQPTTLLLTTPLQQLRGAGKAGAVQVINPNMPQIRPAVGQSPLQGIRIKTENGQPAAVLPTSVEKSQTSTSVPAPQILLSSKLNPLLTINRQLAPQIQGTGPRSVTPQPAGSILRNISPGTVAVRNVTPVNQGPVGNIVQQPSGMISNATSSTLAQVFFVGVIILCFTFS